MKNDIGELDTDLQMEKEKNLQLNQNLIKLKKELAAAKRTITNYRKIVTEMNKNFFKQDKTTAPSSYSGFTNNKLAVHNKEYSSFGEGTEEENHSIQSGIKKGLGNLGLGTITDSFSVLDADSVS